MSQNFSSFLYKYGALVKCIHRLNNKASKYYFYNVKGMVKTRLRALFLPVSCWGDFPLLPIPESQQEVAGDFTKERGYAEPSQRGHKQQ